MSSVAPNNSNARQAELALLQLEALPPLAPIATRILTLTADPKTNARQIIDLIGTDPALTTRMLAVLARADHRLSRQAITIENAVTHLGFAAIRQMTLALAVMQALTPASGGAREGFNRADFWKHCLGVACAARQIAEALPRFGSPDEAFIHGLLHDIGKIAIEAAMPKTFDRIIQRTNAGRRNIADVERELIGIDHAAAGYRLAVKWSLPQKLMECIWLHHHHPETLPASVATGGHVQLIQAADTMVRELRIGYSGNHPFAISSRVLTAALGLPEAKRAQIAGTLVEEIERRSAWIGEETINARDLYVTALIQTTDELTLARMKLVEQSARLARERAFFAALQGFSTEMTPTASVRDVCAAGARAIRQAMGLEVVHVQAPVGDGRWEEWGRAADELTTGIAEDSRTFSTGPADLSALIDTTAAGVWLTPPEAPFLQLADSLRGCLGSGSVWMLPIVHGAQPVGVAFFAADGRRVGALRTASAEIAALGGAIGLAIAQAQSRAAATRLSSEFADVNRKMGTVESELLAIKNFDTMVSLAAGAAHEMNNPLSVISGRAQMLMRSEHRDDVKTSLEIIARQAHVCSAIVSELMAFARSPDPSPVAVDVRTCIERAAAGLATAGLLADGVLDVSIPSDTPRVLFDPAHLQGIFHELIKNAIEASETGTGRLSIKAVGKSTEDGVVVHVIDQGRGMTADVLDRAMEPFFSDRPAGRGRGLGLARVRRWLHQGGGRIRLDSEPGRGTIVELWLPPTAS